jgi:transcriptional regulator with XRE-family HTH domain
LKFIKVYGHSSPSFSTIKKLAGEFNRGRTSLEEDPREGRPKSETTPETIEQVHDMVLDDRRMKVREIAETIGISKERVGYILHEELDMKVLGYSDRKSFHDVITEFDCLLRTLFVVL